MNTFCPTATLPFSPLILGAGSSPEGDQSGWRRAVGENIEKGALLLGGV
jgi:hypothetical protein